MMKALPLREWSGYLRDWADPSAPGMSGSPKRRELAILGELAAVGGKLDQFLIGRSRDEYGTVLQLTPEQHHRLLGQKLEKDPNAHKAEKEAKKTEKAVREWNQWWAKIAVRAGYLFPTIDPTALARLHDLRHRDSRVEFIVDTNVLISGVGHWLVRCFGDTCDLVRTVVTDLEIQRFGDTKKWAPSTFEELATRTSYLTASRFLEYLAEQHPIWRRLDIEEETALFVSSASKGGAKEPGADTLLLRAVRRSLQDQVPGLIRLFVTGDQNLARAATHDLPPESTIAAYVNPLPEQGRYLSSVHWWPKRGLDGGAGYFSNLADFSYEATCLCDAVQLVKPNGEFLRIRSYVPGRNQFPTDWRDPSVWVEEGVQAPTAVAGPLITSKRPIEAVEVADLDNVAQSAPEREIPVARMAIPGGRSGAEVKNWPFKSSSALVTDPVTCVARVSGPALLDVLAAIMLAARESRSISERVFTGSAETVRELRSFLRAVDALDANGQPGSSATNVLEVFTNNDGDALSRLLTKASGYHNLIEQLSSRRTSALDGLDLPRRSATSLVGLARLLGQVVDNNGELIYGGAYLSQEEFITWFMKTIEIENKGPLGGNLLADIARKALYELSVSPARMEKAMEVAIQKPPLSDLDFVAGGTPEHILEEEVAVLSSRGWHRRKVSADGLLGYRSVRKR